MKDNSAFLNLVSTTEKWLDELIPLRVIERQRRKLQNYWDLKDALKEKSEQLKQLHFWQSKKRKEIKDGIKMHKFQLSHFYKEDEVDKIILYTLEAKGW